MKADEILRKHEDANEMHFHEVDRKWIIEAMEEYAALRQPPVIGLVCDGCGSKFDAMDIAVGVCYCCQKEIKQTDL